MTDAMTRRLPRNGPIDQVQARSAAHGHLKAMIVGSRKRSESFRYSSLILIASRYSLSAKMRISKSVIGVLICRIELTSTPAS